MQYKKKLTDIFLRKDQKVKKQPVIQKPKTPQFDESYFQVQLICDNINTALMKIAATVKKGPNSGQQIPLKCKWYTKNQFDFKEIQDVKGNCFQPCLQDVGNMYKFEQQSICVQVEPYIEGMIYTGITIMKESDQLKLDKKLENLSNDYFVSKHLQMEGKIQVMYSQNPLYEKYEFPLDVVVELRERKVRFYEKVGRQLVSEYEIGEDYPQIDFIRKSFNSILFTCNQSESMKLSLTNNFNRDLFSLIIRSIPSRISSLSPSSEQDLPSAQLSSPVRHKSLIQQSSPCEQTTKLILKIDQLHKEIKNLKRINQEMAKNYHLERNAKINLQNQIEKIKTILQKTNEEHKQCKPLHTKIKQVTEENKFYFGEISLIKNENKEKNHLIKELRAQISKVKQEKISLEAKMTQLSQAPATKIESLEKELQTSKTMNEKLESQNESLKQTINQLQNQKNLLKKKVTSIVSEKSLPSTPVRSATKMPSIQDLTPVKQNDPNSEVKSLKMQIANLEMLLKHKSGQKGGEMIGMQMLVNSLTEKIAEKEIEIDTLKKINKEMNRNVSAFSLKDIK